MPRLSYPKGRTAAARSEDELKSHSIKLADAVEDTLLAEEPEVVVAPEDDASVAFQKQIDALRESERLHKERNATLVQEREDAIRRANEREAEVTSLKKTNVESQAETINAGLAAATAEAETAQRDIEKALELGDFKGQADAYRRLSRAETNIARLEDGKSELETQTKAAAEVKPQSNDPIENANIPPVAKTFLRNHPNYITDAKLNARLQNAHHDAIEAGHTAYSNEYFDFVENAVERRKPQEQIMNDDDEEYTRKARSMTSAPVSRESVPSASGERPGTVRLSVAQKEAAKIAGISEKDYAEQVLKLRQEKLNGNYGGAP